jgi:protein-ribulosamine 3-kinase
MMLGEFTSMETVYSVLPDFAPRPISWGTYASDPECHFFLATFHEMAEELPDINAFAWKVAELHMKSESPNGKFGFPVTTFSGNAPQDNSWTDTWEAFFTQALTHMLNLERESQGPSDEMERLREALVQKVIPRLLRPMEMDGRKVKPCLVHGDLWYGNACTDLKTNSPIVFDACSFYAHHECGSIAQSRRDGLLGNHPNPQGSLVS